MKEEQKHIGEGFSGEAAKQMDASKQGLHVPDGYFEASAVLLESALSEKWEVPSDYFEQQSNSIIQQLQKPSTQRTGQTIRLWVAFAAAAVTAGVLLMLVPGKEEVPGFAEQLEQTSIEFEDLEQLDFDEEVYEEFIILDTIKPDTSVTLKKPISIEDFKPSKGQSVLTWDDISAEDIEEYLNEEETIEIIDELY